MGLQTILFVICLSLAPTADNQEKVQKKELEAKVKTITAESPDRDREICSGVGTTMASVTKDE
jgi:hypothetical protein